MKDAKNNWGEVPLPQVGTETATKYKLSSHSNHVCKAWTTKMEKKKQPVNPGTSLKIISMNGIS